MDLFFGIITGALIMFLIVQRPIRFEVHHKYENLVSEQTKQDLRELEDKMFKTDAQSDENYDNYDKNITDVMNNINNLMGGSDRDGQ